MENIFAIDILNINTFLEVELVRIDINVDLILIRYGLINLTQMVINLL